MPLSMVSEINLLRSNVSTPLPMRCMARFESTVIYLQDMPIQRLGQIR